MSRASVDQVGSDADGDGETMRQYRDKEEEESVPDLGSIDLGDIYGTKE